MDKYYYSRDHEQGPGSWCIRGPDGFKCTIPNLDKGQAFLVGKILSGKYKEVHKWFTEQGGGLYPIPSE